MPPYKPHVSHAPHVPTGKPEKCTGQDLEAMFEIMLQCPSCHDTVEAMMEASADPAHADTKFQFIPCPNCVHAYDRRHVRH